jgi:hypothetical protein
MNRWVGHHGRNGCCLLCPMPGVGVYYPAMLQRQGENLPAGSLLPDAISANLSFTTVSTLSWAQDIRTHGIVTIVECLLGVPWKLSKDVGREVHYEKNCRVRFFVFRRSLLTFQDDLDSLLHVVNWIASCTGTRLTNWTRICLPSKVLDHSYRAD